MPPWLPPLPPSPWLPTHYLLAGAGGGEDSGSVVRLPLAHFPALLLPRGAGPEDGAESAAWCFSRTRCGNLPRPGSWMSGVGEAGSQGVSAFIYPIFLQIMMIPPHHPQEGVLRALALTAERPQFKVSIPALLFNLLCDLGQVVLPLCASVCSSIKWHPVRI